MVSKPYPSTQEKEHLVGQQKGVLLKLQTERNDALELVAAYRGSGVQVLLEYVVSCSPSQPVPKSELEQENAKLRRVVREMRIEMESISKVLLFPG